MTLLKATTRRCLAIILQLLLMGTSSVAQSTHADASLRRFLEQYLKPPVLGQGEDPRYSSAFLDLKDDGNLEAIVYLNEPSWCGSGGCTTLVLAPKDNSYQVITKITVTRLPICVLHTKTNGWHDLSVVVAGGGVPRHVVKLAFDGRAYPSNPTVPPASSLDESARGKIVIASGSDDPKSAVEQVLQTQQEAWNRHDLDAFMAGYWNSPDLTFFSDAKETSGWQATLDRYKATYDSPGHEMGKLDFSDLRVEMLDPEAAFVRGAWHLTMSDGKTPHGRFTLIFRKFPEGWKIIHDHTSSARD